MWCPHHYLYIIIKNVLLVVSLYPNFLEFAVSCLCPVSVSVHHTLQDVYGSQDYGIFTMVWILAWYSSLQIMHGYSPDYGCVPNFFNKWWYTLLPRRHCNVCTICLFFFLRTVLHSHLVCTLFFQDPAKFCNLATGYFPSFQVVNCKIYYSLIWLVVHLLYLCPEFIAHGV